MVNMIAFSPISGAIGWKIYLGNYNTITELLRMFIISEVFLAFELNRPRFESRSLGVRTWKHELTLCFNSMKREQ